MAEDVAQALRERIPPHNIEAEQSLLGSMFLSSDVIEGCLAIVSEEDFYRPAHQKIFAAIRDLNMRGEAVDQVTVAARLEGTGELDAAGGKAYLLDITGAVPIASNGEFYAQIVERTSVLRQLIKAATNIQAYSYTNPDEVKDVVARAEKEIFAVTNKQISNDFKAIDELMKKGFEGLEYLFDHKSHVTGVPTGFADLDKILAGMHKGDLIILAARPSVGKTALALNIAVNAAKAGTAVGVFSLEMSSEQLAQRILCAEARVDSQKLRTGYLADEDWPLLSSAMGRLAPLPLSVDDTAGISLLEVRAKARRLLRGAGQGLIIVDYLQLMQPAGRRSENRQVEVAEISRGLKVLAKELECPVLVLSQLSRRVEDRQGKRPQLSDLRESGAIEQDADVVMFIDRNTDPGAGDDGDRPGKGEAEVIVAKHRNGPTDSCRLTYLERFTRFQGFAQNP